MLNLLLLSSALITNVQNSAIQVNADVTAGVFLTRTIVLRVDMLGVKEHGKTRELLALTNLVSVSTATNLQQVVRLPSPVPSPTPPTATAPQTHSLDAAVHPITPDQRRAEREKILNQKATNSPPVISTNAPAVK